MRSEDVGAGARAPERTAGEAAVELHGITKQFPGVLACNHIDLSIKKGEILALLGENGAGKSTLMNILSGLIQPTEGSIVISGAPVKIDSTRVALRHGIGMVHQHFMLVGPLSVAENVALGVEPGGPILDRPDMERRVASLSRDVLGFDIPPRTRVEDLSVGLQQRVEILKALYRGADILILDEPTAVLTPQETEELFRIMRQMASEGRAIVFISHKLHEVLAIADRIVVLRAGSVVGETVPAATNRTELASMMVGRPVLLRVEKPPYTPGEPVLGLHDLKAEGTPGLRGVSFEVRAGEIFGIAGVDGNGQVELEEVLSGLRPVQSGTVTLDGRSIVGLSPRQMIARGIAHIPSDRGKWGMAAQATIWENACLADYRRPPFGRAGIIRPRLMQAFAARLIKSFDIRATGPFQRAGTLSGGNQQKLVVAREVAREGRFVIAAQPTRGVDVGATEFIHRELVRLRSEGRAVLLISADLDEVMSLSDRIGVLYSGELMGIRDGATADRNELGLLMAGVREGAA